MYQLWLEILRGINNSMGSPWQLHWINTTFLAIIVLYVVAVVSAHVWRNPDRLEALPSCLLIASLISLRTAFLRSDVAHIVQAFSPVVFLFLLLATKEWEFQWRQVVWEFSQSVSFLHGRLPTSAGPVICSRWFAVEMSPRSAVRGLLAAQKQSEDSSDTSLLYQDLQRRPDTSLVTFRYDNYLSKGLRTRSLLRLSIVRLRPRMPCNNTTSRRSRNGG